MLTAEDYINALSEALRVNAIPEQKISGIVAYADSLLKRKLPVIFDQLHLALLTGYDFDYLQIVSNSPQDFYKEYSIPKRNGGRRIIHEPYPNLRDIQRWILDNILLSEGAVGTLLPSVTAFVPGSNILQNCRPHAGKSAVLSLDIKNFFDSVRWNQIFYLFREMGYGKDVAGMLSHLCTLNGTLPQGAPTSPMLSNLILREIDHKINKYCLVRGIAYTRYADDLTFSSQARFDYGRIIGYAKSLLAGKRFCINEAKTKVFHRNHSQIVTGIVVNEFPHTTRKYRRKIRQEMYYLSKYGIEEHCGRLNTRFKDQSYIKHLLGKVNFALHICNNDPEMQTYRTHLRLMLSQQKQTPIA